MAYEYCPLGETYKIKGSVVGASAITNSVDYETNFEFNTPSSVTENPDGSLVFYRSTAFTGREFLALHKYDSIFDGWAWGAGTWSRVNIAYSYNHSISHRNYFYYHSTRTGPLATTAISQLEVGTDTSTEQIYLKVGTGGTLQYISTVFGDNDPVSIDLNIVVNSVAAPNVNVTATLTIGAESVQATGDIDCTGDSGVGGWFFFTSDVLDINHATTITKFYAVGDGMPNACSGDNPYVTVIPRIPLVNYSTTIDMGWRINTLSNAKVSVYDTLKDKYTTEYSYIREVTEAVELDTLAEVTSRGIAVAIDTIHGESAPAFYPFGPHVSNVNPQVNIIDYISNGQVDPFGTIHSFNLIITPEDTLTFGTQGAICAGAGFRFGSLTNTELPTMEYRSEYKVNSNRYGSTTKMNYNPATAQHQYCRLTWTGSLQNAKNILIEALINIRSLTFTMNAGSNHYPFGVGVGQGDFTVRISDPTIEVESISADTWRVSLEVVKC